MSKRHQANRRRTYGRRQHEVRERQDRHQGPESFEFELDSWMAGHGDARGFLDPRPPRLRYALGD